MQEIEIKQFGVFNGERDIITEIHYNCFNTTQYN